MDQRGNKTRKHRKKWGRNSSDFRFGSEFLDMTLKAQAQKKKNINWASSKVNFVTKRQE